MRHHGHWVQHLIGMAGQVTAALPQVLVTLFLARRVSLESAGHFTVVAGLAAAAFTVAAWGFVPHMVLERFRRFPAATYLAARAIALLLIAGFTLAVGFTLFPETGRTLLLAVIALRAADAIIELHFGFAQVWFGAQHAIQMHAVLHAGKLLLLATPLLFAMRRPAATAELAILTGSIAALAGAALALIVRRRIWARSSDSPESVAALFSQASWFGIAAILCGVVTNLPRMSLPLAYDGAALGVAGISLTIATFFGMALYTAWVRHFPQLAVGRDPARAAIFLREYAIVSGLCAAAAVLPLPPLAAWLFDFDLRQFGGEMRGLLLAAVVFFAGMGLANLYKLGRRLWRESLVYLAATLLAAGLGAAVLPGNGLALPLLSVGVLMALLSVPAMRTALDPNAAHD